MTVRPAGYRMEIASATGYPPGLGQRPKHWQSPRASLLSASYHSLMIVTNGSLSSAQGCVADRAMPCKGAGANLLGSMGRSGPCKPCEIFKTHTFARSQAWPCVARAKAVRGSRALRSR